MTTVSPFRLGPSSLTEALYESLRTRIVNGEIKPGEKLTEQRVAGEYGVARPTAKACLERLTALGLLRRTAHKTATVPELDADDIADLFFSREMFERAAAAHLAGLKTVPTDALKSQRQIEVAVADQAFADQVQADIAFHWALITGVGSPRLTRMYEMINGEIQLTMGQFQAHRRTTPSTVAAEHAAIIAAIEAGDVEEAEFRTAEHLWHARDRVLAQHASEVGERDEH